MARGKKETQPKTEKKIKLYVAIVPYYDKGIGREMKIGDGILMDDARAQELLKLKFVKCVENERDFYDNKHKWYS